MTDVRETKPCPICGRSMVIRGGGMTHHMQWHVRNGDLGKDCNIGEKGDIIRSGDGTLRDLLAPVVTSGAVAIGIEGPRMYRKQRIGKQVLFITMGWLYGDPRAIVFGLLGGGCELQKIDDLKLTPLIRIGLQADMAEEIISQLRELLSVNQVDSEK